MCICFEPKHFYNAKRFGKGCLADAYVVKRAFETENLDCVNLLLGDSFTILLLTALIPIKPLKIIVETEHLFICMYIDIAVRFDL